MQRVDWNRYAQFHGFLVGLNHVKLFQVGLALVQALRLRAKQGILFY
jgi:hypothetical protein